MEALCAIVFETSICSPLPSAAWMFSLREGGGLDFLPRSVSPLLLSTLVTTETAGWACEVGEK